MASNDTSLSPPDSVPVPKIAPRDTKKYTNKIMYTTQHDTAKLEKFSSCLRKKKKIGAGNVDSAPI